MRAATVVLVALLALACVGLSSAFRLGVRMTAGAGVGTRVGAGAGAAAEAESDPHRLLGRKLEKLRAATETAKNSAKAADEAPLPEYEITDDGISEVKSMATDAAPSKTVRNSFYTATSASVASVAVGAGAGVSAATEGMVLMALSEHIAPFADADAVTPALLEGMSSPPSSPKSSDPAMDRKIAVARKKQKKGTLSCKCTFVPLPNKLPPLKPEQKKTPTGDAAEAKRAAALLKKLTASKKPTAAKPAATPAPTTATTATPAPTAAPAPVTAATPAPAATAATAAAAVSSGTITPLKALLESESQTRATSASLAAAPQFAPMLDTDV